MSVSISVEIIQVDHDGQQLNSFTTSGPCDSLALMFYDWKDHTPVVHLGVLNEEEVRIVKATYGKDSMSVLDNLEAFKPQTVSIEELIPVFTKIRNKIIYPQIKEAIRKNDDYELANQNGDLIAISECIGALEVMKNVSDHAYITINDF
ncbi:hypothetical protein [Paraflavitalea sp. CAU 1676]|uniref:hypothetical protein n=1 Tax=Paraflavitalea sp. CAU 1676 TaxID=3032598 RepID=UPI0023DCDD18|nr:hypothetical protein [Paraflavitalea sp. CAU 1676]MDF2192677.1 hypothetical protein [Paraflavitalea sp. CAU 1676]